MKMPQIIKFIDEIGREKQRDVLYLEFYPKPENMEIDSYEMYRKIEKKIFDFDFENSEIRSKVINWLNKNKISYSPCGRFSQANGIVKMQEKYLGNLYLDIPFDKENTTYRKLEKYFENSDGSMKFQDVRFCYVSLEVAMDYALDNEDE